MHVKFVIEKHRKCAWIDDYGSTMAQFHSDELCQYGPLMI